MRLFHLLPPHHALSDLTERRLKIAQIGNLNDPFELWSSDHRDAELRAALRRWKSSMSTQFGMLCFSAGWDNPLLWSHYADRHKGICLGFDVRDELVEQVSYVKTRAAMKHPFTEEKMRRLLFTKYVGWSYEDEWRLWCRLESHEPDNPQLYFREFDDDLVLREVISGPLCDLTESAIREAIRHYSHNVQIKKSRLAFGAFRVVENWRGFKNPRQRQR